MRTPTQKDIKQALNRAKSEYPEGDKIKIIDTAWALLNWEYSQVDERRIEDQYRKDKRV